MGDITKMMEQISVEDSDKNIVMDRWDKAYGDVLSQSGVGRFCEIWIDMFKKSPEL